MKKFKIKLHIDEIIEAENEEEAFADYEDSLTRNNETLLTHFCNASDVVEICPHCEIELESKMIDIDGTNLEEHLVCEKCGYGYPALR